MTLPERRPEVGRKRHVHLRVDLFLERAPLAPRAAELEIRVPLDRHAVEARTQERVVGAGVDAPQIGPSSITRERIRRAAISLSRIRRQRVPGAEVRSAEVTEP